MNIDREFLDRVMPDSYSLQAAASRLAGLSFGASDSCVVLDCMNWMAEFTERDRFYGFGDRKPAWKTPQRFENVSSISMRGLEYKNSCEYLTAEGWPTGTNCWYVCVECGWRIYVCAETPKLAALRAVVVMCVAAKARDIDPEQRRFIQMLEDEMAEKAAT